MSISMIQMQAALARTDDIAKIEQSKNAIRSRQMERQKEHSEELANERSDTISEALAENVIEKIRDDDTTQGQGESHLAEKKNKEKTTLAYRDLNLGGHIDLSV